MKTQIKEIKNNKNKMKANNEVKEFLRKAGKKGGSTTKKKFGTEHFRRIGEIGKATRWGKRVVDK